MNWQENWHPEVGLWWGNGPGHTQATKNLDRLHSGVTAATQLVMAGREGVLSQMDAGKVLSALREMQHTEDGDLYGCMRWYWEEQRPQDTNAAFFIGLRLIVLRKRWYGDLSQPNQETLNIILKGLRVWFVHAVSKKTFFYPNKFLGDLVCAWLLLEILDAEDEGSLVRNTMLEAADYWLENGWGWGEHLSDGYSSVCLDELSVLLLLSERLPDDLRKRYTELLNALLAIEDAYDGGPRVPALRSYAFRQSRNHTHYRDQVSGGSSALLGDLLNSLGWHDRVAPRSPRGRDLTIPCFNGATACARIEADARLGATSRFPVMPSAEYPSWGLAWQSMPVAFWHAGGDWGFMQWQTQENGEPRAHPALGGPPAHLPKTLTQSVLPPIVGRTCAVLRGGDLLVLRVMPAIAATWEQLTDRFRLIETRAGVSETGNGDTWRQLLLGYPKRTVSVNYVNLTGAASPKRMQNEMGGLDWDVTYSADDLQGRRAIVHLWGFSLNGQIEHPPEVHPLPHHLSPQAAEERAWEIHWPWPQTEWHVHLDPKASNPIQEI